MLHTHFTPLSLATPSLLILSPASTHLFTPHRSLLVIPLTPSPLICPFFPHSFRTPPSSLFPPSLPHHMASCNSHQTTTSHSYIHPSYIRRPCTRHSIQDRRPQTRHSFNLLIPDDHKSDISTRRPLQTFYSHQMTTGQTDIPITPDDHKTETFQSGHKTDRHSNQTRRPQMRQKFQSEQTTAKQIFHSVHMTQSRQTLQSDQTTREQRDIPFIPDYNTPDKFHSDQTAKEHTGIFFSPNC